MSRRFSLIDAACRRIYISSEDEIAGISPSKSRAEDAGVVYLELHSIQGVTAEDLSLWEESMGRISYGLEGVYRLFQFGKPSVRSRPLMYSSAVDPKPSIDRKCSLASSSSSAASFFRLRTVFVEAVFEVDDLIAQLGENRRSPCMTSGVCRYLPPVSCDRHRRPCPRCFRTSFIAPVLVFRGVVVSELLRTNAIGVGSVKSDEMFVGLADVDEHSS